MKKDDKDLELSLLREENERLKAQEEARVNDRNNVYFNELRNIQKVGEKTKGEITYKDIHHPTVTLWRKDGKRIGPLHPANAETTFQRFYDVGVLLSMKKPTDEDIAKYKLTPEWKKIESALVAKRKLREKSKKPDQIQKLAEVLQNQFGVGKADINNIKKLEEVGV